jgi:5-methylcytosine-specific restriction protein A
MPALFRPRATEVDHVDGLGPLGPRGHDWANLQALTKAHHSRKTGRETGFGNH